MIRQISCKKPLKKEFRRSVPSGYARVGKTQRIRKEPLVMRKKSFVQVKESESRLERVGITQGFHKWKKTENNQLACLQEHQYNPPSKNEKPKRHMLILDHCQESTCRL